MSVDARGPGIRFPPPFVYAAGWVVAWALDRRLAFRIAGTSQSTLQVMAGLAMLAAGLAVVFWGLITFARHRTAVFPTRPARLLVAGGPYRFTRNPMYVGLTLAYVGLALVSNWAWPLVMLVPVVAIISRYVIRREEQHLRSSFGATFDDYCRRVRRWM
jgi:protein-S-isoprenylcysteine O-methyltransferase Ste14